MEIRNLTCINCPLGCQLEVALEEKDGTMEVVSVTGNTCKRGEIYGKKEVLSPTRVVTSTVRVEGGTIPVVSVKTKEDIPKSKILAVMEQIQTVTAKAPVRIGDVLIENIAETGVDLVATKEIQKAGE